MRVRHFLFTKRFQCGAAALLWCLWIATIQAEERLAVFVTLPPLQTLVEQVGGARVAVQTLVPPGRSPETYEPTPRQVADLAAATLYVRVGMPFEEAWLERIRAANARLIVFDARTGIDLLPAPDHRHEPAAAHPPETTASDPHVWTSPRLLRIMAAQLRDRLTALDPDHAATYRAAHTNVDAELAALDAELSARLAPLRQRGFLVYHPAWGYFADAYGLEQIAIEHEGKEPSARRLGLLVEQARARRIGIVFNEPQSNRRPAERIAQAIGGRVVVVDPLAPDYAATLRQFAAALRAAEIAPDAP